jgi:hypothetical protein
VRCLSTEATRREGDCSEHTEHTDSLGRHTSLRSV